MSAPLSPAARTRTRTWPAPGSGSGCSATTSSPPSRMVTARMASGPLGLVHLDGLGVGALGGDEEPGRRVRRADRHELLALALDAAVAQQRLDGRVDLRALHAEDRSELAVGQAA